MITRRNRPMADEWKEKLDDEQYHVLREAGTERPFTGKYWDTKTEGIYHCSGCGQALFTSDTKFDSGTGWPSFSKAVAPEAVTEHEDNSLGVTRTEVVCSNCEGHLGHIFPDGPQPSGLRYCLNSVCLDLKPKE
jgi:peptide-methionine (R)-S-oxide reductase